MLIIIMCVCFFINVCLLKVIDIISTSLSSHCWVMAASIRTLFFLLEEYAHPPRVDRYNVSELF